MIVAAIVLMSHVEAGAALGYAFPGGAIERGSRTSDVTHGAPTFVLDGAYRVHKLVSVGGAFAYGIPIPKLCASSSDCTSSLGHEIAMIVFGRIHAPRWRAVEPSVDAGLGYEWLSTKLSSKDVSSTRSYRCFATSLAANVMLSVSSRVALGLRIELRGGIFHRASLDAPGVSVAGGTDGSKIHLWPIVALRATATF